jgi:hypothetical protein
MGATLLQTLLSGGAAWTMASLCSVSPAKSTDNVPFCVYSVLGCALADNAHC